MRKWHRWLSVFFGVFLLWIAVTGVASQFAPLMVSGPERAQEGAAAVPAVPRGFVCPEGMSCRPKRTGGANIVGTLHHLHSGESFGPVGVVIATLSGLAMIFFSFSGVWLYVQMWRFRSGKGLSPRWLWK